MNTPPLFTAYIELCQSAVSAFPFPHTPSPLQKKFAYHSRFILDLKHSILCGRCCIFSVVIATPHPSPAVPPASVHSCSVLLH